MKQLRQTWMDSPKLAPVRHTLRIIQNVIKGFNDDEVMTRAAALAFYSALSMAPILILLLWVVSSLKPEWQAQLIANLTEMVGDQAGEGLRIIIANSSQEPQLGNLAGLIGLAVTLIGASMLFAQLQRAINAIWGIKSRPGKAWLKWLRSRMNALGLLLTVAFLLMVSFVASATIALFVHGHTELWNGLEMVLALIIFTIVFAAMFKVLPDAIISWHDALLGAALTSILFALGKYAIGIYLDHSHVGGAYGPAGSVIVLLVWVYYSALILLLGAEFTEALAYERGSEILPRSHAMRITIIEQTPSSNHNHPDVDLNQASTSNNNRGSQLPQHADESTLSPSKDDSTSAPGSQA